jgi:hypothetical protein
MKAKNIADTDVALDVPTFSDTTPEIGAALPELGSTPIYIDDVNCEISKIIKQLLENKVDDVGPNERDRTRPSIWARYSCLEQI